MSEKLIKDIHTADDLDRMDKCMRILSKNTNMGSVAQNALTLLQIVLIEAIQSGQESPLLVDDEIKTIETSIAETMRDMADNLEAGKFRKGGK